MTTRDLGKLWLLPSAGVTDDEFMVQTEIAAKRARLVSSPGGRYGTQRRQKKLRTATRPVGTPTGTTITKEA